MSINRVNISGNLTRDPELRERALRLMREGKGVNPVFMKGDFTLNRWLRMLHTTMEHFKIFKRYYRA